MSQLENKAIDILEKLEKLSGQYAPEVMGAAIRSVQISAVGELIYGLLAIVLLIIAYTPLVKMVNWFKAKRDNRPCEMWDVGGFVATAVYCVPITFLVLYGVYSLFDIWNWTAIFSPKLTPAHKVMGL